MADRPPSLSSLYLYVTGCTLASGCWAASFTTAGWGAKIVFTIAAVGSCMFAAALMYRWFHRG